MDLFLSRGWDRMDWFNEGKLQVTVRRQEDVLDPLILTIH